MHHCRTCLALALGLGLLTAGCGGGGGGSSSSTTETVTTTTSTSQTTTSPPLNSASNTTVVPVVVVNPVVPPVVTVAGDPLAGLTADLLTKFQNGRTAFLKNEQGEARFGPLFNGNSCVQCHNAGAPGGAGVIQVTRFGKVTNNVFDPLTNEGGTVLQALSLPGRAREVVPLDANVRTNRRTTSVMGAGLVEAIPDSAIVDNAKLQLAANPLQAGQLNFVTSLSDGAVHVGRFGWKCQHAFLLDFSADAYANEMGVSSALVPSENVANAAPRAIPLDQVEDRPDATGLRNVDRFTDFMRLLAPPPTKAAVPQGERTFTSIGCVVCHHPSFGTVSTIPALNGKTVNAYSDFLLHDVGTGDGIEQTPAPANKIRTAPLMGVSAQPSFLHDGSARTITAAILAHGGEATSSRQAFQALSGDDRQSLLDFLNSL